MPVIASADSARAARRRASSNGTPFWLTSYIGANRYGPAPEQPPGPGEIYPMAFLVEQDPGAVVGAHFHQADQFQVVLGGSGRLGRHDVAPMAVHFAGAWSAYGPLTAGEEGLSYFTLRNGWDPGARYMQFPQERAALRAVERHHREVVGEVAASDDGLCTRRYVLDPLQALIGSDPTEGGGQFWLVLSGSMQSDRARLPPMSCVFVHPDEPAFRASAGENGMTALMLQFPRKAA